MRAWKKILCPVDFSQPARSAMRLAADLSARFGAELTLFHAYPLPGYTLPEGSVLPSTKMLQDLADQAEAHLVAWKGEAEALGAGTVATAKSVGEPASEIAEVARRGGFDLVVVGTHGRTGLRHALLGSVAERVVRKVACPVLTVRPEAEGRGGD
jgi:nucleotide-binding universal stress UspA family protein